MKKFLSIGALAAMVCLSACANTAQGKLRQTVYSLDSAYHLLANPIPDAMAGNVPGVKISDDNKVLIKKASQTVFNEIQSLETSIEANKSITSAAVAAVQADFASFTECWTGAKAGTIPDSCKSFITTTTAGK